MPILVICECGKRYQAKEKHAGKVFNCRDCGKVLHIPAAPPTAEAQASPVSPVAPIEAPAPGPKADRLAATPPHPAPLVSPVAQKAVPAPTEAPLPWPKADRLAPTPPHAAPPVPRVAKKERPAPVEAPAPRPRVEPRSEPPAPPSSPAPSPPPPPRKESPAPTAAPAPRPAARHPRRPRRGGAALRLGVGGGVVAAAGALVYLAFFAAGSRGTGREAGSGGAASTSLSVPGAKLEFATGAGLAEGEKSLAARAQGLIGHLGAGGDPIQVAEELRNLRPLPASAVAALIECLSASRGSTRSQAAFLLAYHQRGGEEALAALRAARKAEKDAGVRYDLDAAIEHLERAGEDLPVLTDSGQLSQLLERAVLRAVQSPVWGRSFIRARTAALGSRQRESTSSTWKDLPERVSLPYARGMLMATLGWRWEVGQAEPGAGTPASVAPAPIGAILCLEGPLELDQSSLPKGAILVQGIRGWCAVPEAQAIARLRAFLGMKHRLTYGLDYRELGALGAAAIGPPARELMGPLTDAARSDPEASFAIYCARALGRIGDKAALPILRRLRERNQELPGVVASVDQALAALER